MTRYDVIGVGAPVIDRILRVGQDFLATLPGELGGMELVDHHTLNTILERSGQVAIPAPGGSASNVIVGLARLGNSCAMIGKVGTDQAGRAYAEALAETGATPHLAKGTHPTSQALSMVCGDGHRTMRTYIGASAELKEEDIDPKLFEGVRLLHLEGYNLFNPAPALRAGELAKAAGAKVSLDLGSFEVVEQFRDHVTDFLAHVDILFANEDEARALTGKEPEEAVGLLSEHCEVVVVMMAEKGSWAFQGELIHHPAFAVDHPVDPTGAGDLYASGFLHGYLRGLPLKECMRMGSLTGAAAVQVLGAALPEGLWSSLYDELLTRS